MHDDDLRAAAQAMNGRMRAARKALNGDVPSEVTLAAVRLMVRQLDRAAAVRRRAEPLDVAAEADRILAAVDGPDPETVALAYRVTSPSPTRLRGS